MKYLLVNIGQGIGNQIEMLPAINLIKQKYPEHTLVFLNTMPHCYHISELIFKEHLLFKDTISMKNTIDVSLIDGLINMPFVTSISIQNISNMTQPTFSYEDRLRKSEILTNLMVVENRPQYPIELYNVSNYLKINDSVINKAKEYDILIHNGYNKANPVKDFWKVKEYDKFSEVAERLKYKYKIASIGKRDEYVVGTIDETNKDIEDSIALIKKCRIFVSTDTGTYHIAAALKKPGVVLFTATSIDKNYDRLFHKSFHIMRRHDLNCQPCQPSGNGTWLNCSINKECKNISVDELIDQIEIKIRESDVQKIQA